jgi:rhodanese-related sulfurtransferase
MKFRTWFWGGLALILALPLGMTEIVWGQEVPRITKEELKEMLDKPDVIVIDVRYGKDWTESKEKIPGAVREDPKKATKTWAGKYDKDKTIVLYCS